MVKSCKKGKYNGSLKVKQYLCRGCDVEKGCWPGGAAVPPPKKSKLLREIEALQSQQQVPGEAPPPKKPTLRRKELKIPTVDWMSNYMW